MTGGQHAHASARCCLGLAGAPPLPACVARRQRSASKPGQAVMCSCLLSNAQRAWALLLRRCLQLAMRRQRRCATCLRLRGQLRGARGPSPTPSIPTSTREGGGVSTHVYIGCWSTPAS